MILKRIHLNLDKELIKWLKIYCIKKNNNLKPSQVVNDLLEKFKEDNS